MKTAIKQAVSFELTCPECGEIHAGEGGSHFWTKEEIQSGETVTCLHCKTKFKLPKVN